MYSILFDTNYFYKESVCGILREHFIQMRFCESLGRVWGAGWFNLSPIIAESKHSWVMNSNSTSALLWWLDNMVKLVIKRTKCWLIMHGYFSSVTSIANKKLKMERRYHFFVWMSSKITFAVRRSRFDNTSMVSEGTVFGNQLEGGRGEWGVKWLGWWFPFWSHYRDQYEGVG